MAELVRVLLVEDDEVDRMAFERFVRREALPYRCSVAGSVAEARERLADSDFDVVLLDYFLGDGTAFDILEDGLEAPVILITGANQIDIAVSAMKAGAYDFLVKDQQRDYLRVLPLAVDGAIRRREAEDTSRVLSHALMSASDSVFITDLEGRVTFLNSAAAETYGYAPEELLGRDIEEIGDIGEVGGEGEYYHSRKGGDEFPVLLSRSLVEDETGRSVAYVVLVRDITERKRAEQELRRINEELEGYAHTVSHDLKGPLASTSVAASVLTKLIDGSSLAESEEVRQSLAVLDSNVWKSAALIDDLLALAEAGQTPESVEDVEVGVIVDRVFQENAAAIDETGIELAIEGSLGSVRGSPAHMYQLFSNLIGNCVKHCDADRCRITVARLEGLGDSHHFLVRDNGSGFPPQSIGRIFAPFFKGPRGGTGIGLATVDKIVKLYGGAIRAYNDHGACFDITIRDFPA
ncbi:MAG: ATP-binding protein [Actinomycetota bacterium]